MTSRDPAAAAVAAWRLESAKLVAVGVRLVRDVGVAEDLAQDALVAALEQWPVSGVPASPGAWLTTVVKRRAVDVIRRNERLRTRQPELARLQEADATRDAEVDPERIDDDLLRLVFIACHPALAGPSRVALTLRLLGGLTTTEIARAFLVPEPTVAQRIVRAKRDLARAGAVLEQPDTRECLERLPAVLQTIYLIFNEGYLATAGSDWFRVSLCDEALRLARLLRALMPADSEVLGLLALCEIQSSRLAARVGPAGEPVLLENQDRSRWDHLRIRRGLDAIIAAEATGEPVGAYLIQAQIAACHARARAWSDTDWAAIESWYDLLAAAFPSPVIELNRAVAVCRNRGPAPALAVLDAIEHDPKMALNNHYWAVRADVLTRLGQLADARDANRRAAACSANVVEEQLLLQRAQDLSEESDSDVDSGQSRAT